MKLIFSYLFRHRGLFALNVLCAFGFAIAELGIPTIFGNMVDGGIDGASPRALYTGFFLIVLVALVGTAGMLCLTLVSTRLNTTVIYEIRRDLFEHAMTFSVADLEHFGVSSMITRTGSDPYQIMLFLGSLLRGTMVSPIMLIVSIILVIQTSIPLSVIVLSTIPFILIGVIVIFRISGPLSEKQQKSLDAINEILRENMSGIRVIRAFNRQNYEERRFEKENDRYRKVSTTLFRLMSLSEPLFFFLMNIATLLIYWVASILLQEQALAIGQLLMFVEYLFHCMMSFMVVCMIFMMVPRASVSARRIQEVLDREPLIQDKDQAVACQPVRDLVFDHVSFSYPGSEKEILKDISFDIHAGQKVAVIGATGSGKSTLIKLINRFYDPSAGKIYLNGQELNEYQLCSLRNQIALVSQKAHMFTGSIQDNILFGNRQADEKLLEESVRISQSADFIAQRDNQLDDWISEEGSNLSGGQKQRLSIARALVSKASLMILDDSFSALDLKTDARLRKELAAFAQNTLFLIIAQRISSILDADLILLMDKGEIVASGTHQSLWKESSLYREIVLSQMSEQEALRYA